MNSHDYFMRQIEDMAQFLTKTFFHKVTEEVPLFDEQGSPLESGILYGTLRAMVQNGKINDAENALFERLENLQKEDYEESENKAEEFLNIAVKFYEQLNLLSDEKLAECNFSREEIFDGLKSVKEICEGM